jgi:hypothetical protein
MPKINPVNKGLAQVWRGQCDLITRSQALGGGMTEAALRARLRPDGPWRVVLPGLYLVHNGGLTVGQRELAAVLYAGRDSVITGPAALARFGVRAPVSEVIDVLIPHQQRRQSKGFVRIHRTTLMPVKPWRADGIMWAPAARAVADAARGDVELRDARALVASAVQQRKCTVQQLAGELRTGPSQRSGPLRAALAEVAVGIRSVAEGDLRKVIKGAGLPEPMYNPQLFVGEEFLASPDAWWPDAGVAAEVDSREWHLSPADWERTQARHARMSAQGILVLHYAPRRIRSDPTGLAAEISNALEAGRRRPPLAIRTLPAR